MRKHTTYAESFAYSKYEQTLILPDDVNKDEVGARMSDGVLNITLPKLKQDSSEK